MADRLPVELSLQGLKKLAVAGVLDRSATAQNLSNDAIKASLRPKIDAFYWRSLLLTSAQTERRTPERESSSSKPTDDRNA
jgi:hypothetical protein